MSMQELIVAVIVVCCVAYAAWALMPTALQRSVAGALARLPLPDRLLRSLGHATRAGGCGGCDSCADGSKPIRIHRRKV
jgi:hypothetical protein